MKFSNKKYAKTTSKPTKQPNKISAWIGTDFGIKIIQERVLGMNRYETSLAPNDLGHMLQKKFLHE